MKKTLIFPLLLSLALLFCACKSTPASDSYTASYDGTTYTVNTVDGTISDGQYTYRYAVSPYGSTGYQLDITYPDGSTYWWRSTSNGGYGGGSANYDSQKYVDGWTLMRVLEIDQDTSGSSGGNILMALFLLALGLMNLLRPRWSWYLSHGWRFKDAEPSDTALLVNQLGGLVALIVGVFLLLASL